MRGKFIVVYGINNLGKTTQAKILTERLSREGRKAEYLKYPDYSLEPFGPLINGYLRGGNPYQFSARELQMLSVMHRAQFEPTLRGKLNSGTIVVAEDYTGTGIAWGVGAGVDEALLKKMNEHLLPEDLAFYLYGQRFRESVEKGHAHEQDTALVERVRAAHDKLAKEYGWIAVHANREQEVIHEEIWATVKKHLL